MASQIIRAPYVGKRFRFLLVAIVSAATSVLLFTNDFVEGLITGLIASLPALFALVMIVAAFRRDDSGSCPCPCCGTLLMVSALASKIAIPCTNCHHYFEEIDGSLSEIEPERVAAQPQFRSSYRVTGEFPEMCCVCCGPARRRQKILLTNLENEYLESVTGELFETSRWKATSASVPHCNDHTDGAVLGVDSRLGPYIRFKSYRYLKAYCELNRTYPE